MDASRRLRPLLGPPPRRTDAIEDKAAPAEMVSTNLIAGIVPSSHQTRGDTKVRSEGGGLYWDDRHVPCTSDVVGFSS